MKTTDQELSHITKLKSLEQQVMSKLLNNYKLYITHSHLFRIRLFRNDSLCTEIFPIFVKILTEGGTPDLVGISNKLRSCDSFNALVELYGVTSNNFNFVSAIDTLRENIIMNEVGQLLYDQDSWEGTGTEFIEYVQNKLIQLTDTGGQDSQHISTKLSDVLNIIENNKTTRGLTGIGTGMSKFDNYTGGFQKGNLIIVGAETSIGKTALALSITNQACIKFGHKAAVYSLEMTSIELAARFGSMSSDISAKRLLVGRLSDGETEKLHSDWRLLNQAGIYISECTSTAVGNIITSIRALKIQEDVELVVIDYLGLISGKTAGGRNQELAQIARTFKNLAKELNIAILLLSQLSRDKTNHFPTLARLRDSGEIEEAADIVMFIYRPEFYGETTFSQPSHISGEPCTGKSLIIVAKGRNIGTFDFMQDFDGPKTLFSEPLNSYNGGTSNDPF